MATKEWPSRAAPAAYATASCARVLVVDDDRSLTDTLARLLANDIVAIEVANDPVEGLAHARQHCPLLIIVDLHLPGMDGYAFIEACRATPGCAEVPIFLATGRRDAGLARRHIDGKHCLVAAEPFDLDTLTAAVQDAIRSHSRGRR